MAWCKQQYSIYRLIGVVYKHGNVLLHAYQNEFVLELAASVNIMTCDQY